MFWWRKWSTFDAFNEYVMFSVNTNSSIFTILHSERYDYCEFKPPIVSFCWLVESNDTLYGNDAAFINEVHQRLSNICEQIIQSLKEFGNIVRILKTIVGIFLLLRLFTCLESKATTSIGTWVFSSFNRTCRFEWAEMFEICCKPLGFGTKNC